MVQFLKNDEAMFAALLAQKTNADMAAEKKYLEAERQKATARNNKVAELFEKLYEDNVEGKVTDEWFLQLSHKYEVDRMELKEKIAELRGNISDLDSMQTNKELYGRTQGILGSGKEISFISGRIHLGLRGSGSLVAC